jgi:hypothetical protein
MLELGHGGGGQQGTVGVRVEDVVTTLLMVM